MFIWSKFWSSTRKLRITFFKENPLGASVFPVTPLKRVRSLDFMPDTVG